MLFCKSIGRILFLIVIDYFAWYVYNKLTHKLIGDNKMDYNTGDPQTYDVWIKISALQTANVRIQASNSYECKQLAEAMYGVGNVLNYIAVYT